MLANRYAAHADNPTVNSRILKLWSERPFALLTEIAIFVAFGLSLYVIANLETIVSLWAMVPHILCNTAVVALIIRHRSLGRPAMYWNHFDMVVVLLFLYFLANIYYSEIRAISWQTAALYTDSLAAYLMGRMLFYHRVRAYALVLTGALLISVLGLYANKHQARQLEKEFHSQAQTMLSAPPVGMSEADAGRASDDLYKKAEYQDSVALRYEPVQRAYILFLCFWALSLAFLWLEKPASLAFLFYGGGTTALYVFYALGRLAWALGGEDTAVEVTLRNAKFESLRTALRIFESYPITGGGLGTFPALFDAYRLTPGAPYGTGFNAFVYCVVETGIIGVLMVLYLSVRLPLHVVRRWKFFPNRRLRFAMMVHLLFFVFFVIQCFFDADMFHPAVWFPVWAIIGTFVSLAMVRDPVRVFDALLPAGRANDPQAINRRVVYSSLGGVFGRTPLAKLPRPRMPLLKKYGITKLLFTVSLTALLLIFSVLEAAPYVGRKLATLESVDRPDLTTEARKSQLGSEEYGDAIKKANRIFPLDSHTWSSMATHYESRINQPLEIYDYSDRIEDSYARAIKLNPYRPELYEKLYFLYRDINRQGDALDIMKEGVQTNPNQLILRLLLIRELERLGDYPLATYHVKQALLTIAPDETELYLRLAELYEIQGQFTDAKLYYLYARQAVPETATTTARLNRLKERLGM